MLWYKAWLETRWRFLIGLGLLLCSAAGAVFAYPQVLKLLPLVPANATGEIGRQIQEKAQLATTYRGFVWSDWFGQNLAHGATLFAALLGTAALLVRSGGTLFTLSLPVSRRRLLGVRAATGLAELLVLSFVPSLVIPLLAPTIGQSYGLIDVVMHGLCLFAASALFFSLALLLSTLFDDAWRPLLLALAAAIFLGVAEQILRSPAYGVFHLMSGETYFRTGHLPWLALSISTALSAAMCGGAVNNFARRDF